jgi:hypothetical protein
LLLLSSWQLRCLIELLLFWWRIIEILLHQITQIRLLLITTTLR